MRQLFFVISLILSSAKVAADLEGVFLINNKTQLILYYRDDQHIRIDMSDKSYMLITDKTVYALTRSGSGWMAMDMNQMAGLTHLIAGANTDVNWSNVIFTPLNETEIVAGYKGQVYTLQAKVNGKLEKREVVMCKDKEVVTLQKALIKMSEKTAKAVGMSHELDFKSLQRTAAANDIGGLLRVEQDLVLQNIKTVVKDLSFYEFPKNTQTMEVPSVFK